jgi:hypothetical protein
MAAFGHDEWLLVIKSKWALHSYRSQPRIPISCGLRLV